MRGAWRRLGGNERGAVAPTVALSLFALIAAGGLAFDYARMAALDTELQNAADQAALAAATQLDQQAGAVARATAAAQALIANQTLFANDGNASNRAVTVPTVMFYQTRADAEANTNGFTDVTRFADARFVRVAVAARQANFALTPIVGAITSGNMNAEAVAGLGSAICKTPPVMICNPTETSTNTSFNPAAYIGTGIKLVSVGNGGGAWAPGNFGYLDTGGGSNGAPGLREALGWVSPPGECLSGSGVDTKPGATVSVTDALNTRFDIYDSNVSCPSGGTGCPASINSVKDVTRAGNANGGNSCRLHNQGWGLGNGGGTYYGQDSFGPATTTPLATTSTPLRMGHPRDICHAVPSGATGACTGPIGTGTWDRDAYFRANYRRSDGTSWAGGTGAGSWRANTGLPADATRYQVYSWEIANRGTTVDGVTVLGARVLAGTGGGANAQRAYGTPQCSSTQGYGAGTVPGTTTVDRRRISVAVVNCLANSVNGNSVDVPVAKWVEAFLVEPSMNRDRTSQGDVYIEVIGETQAGGAGATAGQVVRRDVPYLVK